MHEPPARRHLSVDTAADSEDEVILDTSLEISIAKQECKQLPFFCRQPGPIDTFTGSARAAKRSEINRAPAPRTVHSA
jgi:hypothetical protein